VKAVDSHRDSLEPLFDVVPLAVIKMTAQVVTNKGSQMATPIDEKFGI